MIIQITDSEREQAATIEQLRQEITAWSVTAENLEAELERLNADKTDLLALNWKQGDKLIQVTDERDALKADANKAVELLATLFDRFENGVPCYEDPEECTGFLGHAVNLDDNEFCSCAELLNRLAPVADKIKAGAAPTSQKPVAEVLLVDGEKVIDASMAFFDSVELGTKLYLAAGAAPGQQVFGGRVDPSYVNGPMEAAPKEQTP